MRQIVPLLGSKYNKANMTSATVQDLVNFYLEQYPQAIGARNNTMALPTPGCTLWVALGGNTVRGMLQHTGVIYIVVDATLYSVNPNTMIVTTLGSIGNAGSPSNFLVRMDAIPNEVVVVEPLSGNVFSYRIDLATFAQVTASQFTIGGVTTPVISVVGWQGYFFYLLANSDYVYYSNLNDGRTVQALNFVQAIACYNNIQAIASSQNYLYFMGDVATEVWQFSGQATGLIIRASGGIMQYGTMSPYSYCVSFDNLYFMATDKTGPVGLGVMNGVNCEVLPQYDLVAKLNSYHHTNIAYSWVDNTNGHNFFNTTIPYAEDTRGRTLSVDTVSQNWFERSSFNQNGLIFPTDDQYLAACFVYFNTANSGLTQLIGDYQSGNVYVQSPSVFSDNNTYIRRTITTPHLIDRDTFITCYCIEMDIERDQGLDGTQQGSVPQVMMQYSKDRGHTWSNEIWRTASVLGASRMRVRWGSIGGARCLTFRFRMSDPINWTIANLTADLEREEPSYGRMIGLE